MISFKGESKDKVAVIAGGQDNDKYVYVSEEKPELMRKINEESVYDLLDDDDFNMNKYKRFPKKDQLKLIRAIELNQEPLDEYLSTPYKKLSEKINGKLRKDLIIESGTIIPLPTSETERIYVAGKTGSGKSWWAAFYAIEYKKMFPKRKVILFTKHKKEKAYKLVAHKEIIVSGDEINDLVKEPLDVTLLSNSLVIFDDCDHVQDRVIQKNLRLLNNDVICNGRKYGIHCVTLQHQLMNYKETRELLNEANKVVFFNSSSVYHVKRYLKVYAGLDPEVIKKIVALKSRWTMINLGIPTYILHEHGIFII